MLRALCLLAVACQLGAQTPAAVTRGTVLRVTLRPASVLDRDGSTQVVLPFEQRRGDTLYLIDASRPSFHQSFAAKDIETVERSTGRYHPYARMTLLGSAAGLAFGAGAAAIITRVNTNPKECQQVSPTVRACNEINRDVRVRNQLLAGAFGTGLFGGAIFAARTSRDHWQLVPLSAIR